MRFQFVVSELGHRLAPQRHDDGVAAMVTITISLTLLGGALMIRCPAHPGSSTTCSNNIEVSVYLQPACGVPAERAVELRDAGRTGLDPQRTLKQLPQVRGCAVHPSSASAYQRFRDDFAQDPDLLKKHAEGRPAGVVRGVAQDLHQFAVINSAVSQAPGVQSVPPTPRQPTLKALFAFFHRVTARPVLP